MTHRTRILLAMALLAAPLLAQVPDSAVAGGTILVVTSDPDSAWVYCDSALAGRTPLRLDTLNAGTHLLRVLHPDVTNWLTEAVMDTLHLAPGEERRVHYDIPLWYSIISIPSGAEVLSGDSLLGVTPLTLHPRHQPGVRSVTVRKQGYGTVTSSLALAARGVLVVPLLPSGEDGGTNDWRVANSAGARASRLPLWVAGGSAIVFGSFAAYYKIQADQQQSEFLRTGNPYYQAERARMDDLSALYFMAAQIGLGAFIAFLVSD